MKVSSAVGRIMFRLEGHNAGESVNALAGSRPLGVRAGEDDAEGHSVTAAVTCRASTALGKAAGSRMARCVQYYTFTPWLAVPAARGVETRTRRSLPCASC